MTKFLIACFVLTPWIILYNMAGFVMWDWNASNWAMTFRFAYCALSSLFSIFFLAAYADYTQISHRPG